MKHIATAARRCAGAQESCARRAPHAGFLPAGRWDLLTAARALKRPLGLTTGDLTVLQALISFLPCKAEATGREMPVHPDMVLVVFASNAALAARAHDMDPRSLRRHILRLEAVGLVARKDSANGKRFPVRRNGRIIDAYGIDLRPGYIALPQLQARARELAAEKEEARTLKTRIQALRRVIIDRSTHLAQDRKSVV